MVAALGGRKVQPGELVEGFPSSHNTPSSCLSSWKVRTVMLGGGKARPPWVSRTTLHGWDPVFSPSLSCQLLRRAVGTIISGAPCSPLLAGGGNWSLWPSSWETEHGGRGRWKVKKETQGRFPGTPTLSVAVRCWLRPGPYFPASFSLPPTGNVALESRQWLHTCK